MTEVEENKKIEEMEKEIAELEKKKAEMLSPPPEIPKEEEKEPEKKEEFTPPDPTIPILAEGGIVKDSEIANLDISGTLIPKGFRLNGLPTPKIEFEGGIYITWIDNRYHINGVRGIPNGNRIIVRSLKAVDSLIRHLQYARVAFDQKEMINTKK